MNVPSIANLDHDEFGYIPYPFRADCGEYVIDSLSDIAEKVAAVESCANPDGYYYPPQQMSCSIDPVTEEMIPKPRTTRPALLHRLPTTHTIRHRDGNPLPKMFRDQDGALIIHLLALLYRTRCQFSTWWFDGRVRVKRDRVAWFEDIDGTVSAVLARVLREWKTWPADRRHAYTNALLMHSRAATYELEWERFLFEYLTLDATWAAARIHRGRRDSPHAERIGILCGRFGLYKLPSQVDELVRLRNDLFHEALWDMSRSSAATAYVLLDNLNARLLLAVGGVRGQFAAVWASLSNVIFGFE